MMRFEGEIDVGNAKEFFAALVGLIQTPGTTVHLDLSGVTFFDSHAISTLIRARKLAQVRHVDLVVDPSPIVLRILGRIGLSDQFHWRSHPQDVADGFVLPADHRGPLGVRARGRSEWNGTGRAP